MTIDLLLHCYSTVILVRPGFEIYIYIYNAHFDYNSITTCSMHRLENLEWKCTWSTLDSPAQRTFSQESVTVCVMTCTPLYQNSVVSSEDQHMLLYFSKMTRFLIFMNNKSRMYFMTIVNRRFTILVPLLCFKRSLGISVYLFCDLVHLALCNLVCATSSCDEQKLWEYILLQYGSDLLCSGRLLMRFWWERSEVAAQKESEV